METEIKSILKEFCCDCTKITLSGNTITVLGLVLDSDMQTKAEKNNLESMLNDVVLYNYPDYELTLIEKETK